MRTFLSACIVVSMLAGCAGDDVDRLVHIVSEESVMQHVRALSDDSLKGRQPGTEGEALTVAYLADHMKSYGLEPAGEDGGWFQDVDITSQRLLPGSTVELVRAGRRTSLRIQDDISVWSGSPRPAVSLPNTEMVFVGYGVQAPEQSWDDYKGMDVANKVLVFLNNDPPSDDPSVFGGKARTYYGRWTYKFDIAEAKGAAGAIVIHTDESAGYPWGVVSNGSWSDKLMLTSEAERSTLAIKAWMSESATRTLMTMAGEDLDDLMEQAAKPDFHPKALGVRLTASLKMDVRSSAGQNVVGLLKGSDPELSREAVVFSSHHDHLGVNAPIEGDSIYNGALDNASGVAMMLEMARGFASLPVRPQRSLLFVFVTAEESGLLGSQYFATHPTIPLRNMAALINIDGFNILGRTRDITFLGYDRSSLGRDIDEVAKVMNMTITPDQHPEQGLFYRSDHFSFAKVGVPSVYLENGSDYVGQPADFAEKKSKEYGDRRYHQPFDQLSDDWPWNLEGMMQQYEFACRLTLRVANTAELPVWNAGDEFEAARLAVFKEAGSQ